MIQVTTAQKKKDTELTVDGSDVGGLEVKLQGLRGQLSDSEIGLLDKMFWRAALAPLDDPSGVDLVGSFFDIPSPTEKVSGGGLYIAANPNERRKIGGGGQQENRDQGPNRPEPPQPPRIDVLANTGPNGGSGGSGGGNPGPTHIGLLRKAVRLRRSERSGSAPATRRY